MTLWLVAFNLFERELAMRRPFKSFVMSECLSWLGYPSYNPCLRCWTDFIPSTCPTLLICVVLYTLNIWVHKCFSYFQYKLWFRILQNNYKGPDIQMTCFEEQKLRDVKGVSTEEPRYIREDGGVNMGRRQYFLARSLTHITDIIPNSWGQCYHMTNVCP